MKHENRSYQYQGRALWKGICGMLGVSLFFGVLLWIWVIVSSAAHLVITIIVYRDAKKLYEPALSISPFLWAAITFAMPIGGMFIYWLMNYSNLTRTNFKI
jgi:hypothetical protein